MIEFLKTHTDPTIVVSVLVAGIIFLVVKFVAEVIWEIYLRNKGY